MPYLDAPTMLRKRADAEAKLADALVSGAPTKPIRNEIRKLDRERREAERAKAEQEATEAEDANATISDALAELIAAVHSRHGEAMAAGAIKDEPAALDARPLTSAAWALCAINADVAAVAERVRQAETEAGTIRDRLASLEERRAHIIARRQAGDPSDDDGAELALIDADKEGLLQLLAAAQVNVDTARAPLRDAKQLQTLAIQELQRAEDQALHEALVRRAERLAGSLLITLRHLDETCARLRIRPETRWINRDLHHSVRKTAAAAGLL